MWDLGFISEEDFTEHVANTLREYAKSLRPYDVARLNENIIDPIKLIIDKAVYKQSWSEVISSEIVRQRDKTNNNSIGYFHQNIFKYMPFCEVPSKGWDVIYRPENGVQILEGTYVSTVYAELKNKYNTMNSRTRDNVYELMQKMILQDDDCACLLVEVLTQHSQDVTWEFTSKGKAHNHRLIRKLSIDRFYSLVTGDESAFHKVCAALPAVVRAVIEGMPDISMPSDTAYAELLEAAGSREEDIPNALYNLAFWDYIGFLRE